MERARPPRSSIPTPVGSNNNSNNNRSKRVPFQDPHQPVSDNDLVPTKIAGPPDPSDDGSTSLLPHSPDRLVKDQCRSNPGHWTTAAAPADGIPRPNLRSHSASSEADPSGRNTVGPKHRPPAGPKSATYGYNVRSRTVRTIFQDDEMDYGLDSSTSEAANTPHLRSDDQTMDGIVGVDSPSNGQGWHYDEYTTDHRHHPHHNPHHHPHEMSMAPISGQSLSADFNTTNVTNRVQQMAATSEMTMPSPDDTDTNSNGVSIPFSSSSASTSSHPDYTIRGTISPLTSQGGSKRPATGDSDEVVSFVFGRPASPLAEAKIASVSRYHQHHPSPVTTKVIRTSSGRRLPSSRRPMSPNSDVMPLRHHQYYEGPPSRRGPGSGGRPDGRRVYAGPSLGVGTAAEPRMHHQSGICCEHCNGCLVELKRQALRLMFPDNGNGECLAQSVSLDNISCRLTIPESHQRWFSATGHCGVCETPFEQLKSEALAMIQSIQLAQTTATPTNIPALVGSCGRPPPYRSRHPRSSKPPVSQHYASSSSLSSSSSSSLPIAAQAQAYLDQNVRAYINPKQVQIITGRLPHHHPYHHTATPPQAVPDAGVTPSRQAASQYSHPDQWQGHAPDPSSHAYSPYHVPSPMTSSSPGSPPPVPSAAVSFFARAAQRLGKKKKRHHSQDAEPMPSYPTKYAEVIRLTPPPAPPFLLRPGGRLQNPGMGKVKVMLKVCRPGNLEQGSSFISADPRKKQVTVFDPSTSGYVTSANRRAGAAAPKMFAFDSVVTPDDSLTELCAGSLAEILQAVVAGADGCLFTYGYSKLGKTHTMLGTDLSSGNLGVMPCAIAWLFKLINDQKDKTGARFSVRVSAVHVSGKEEVLKDLLADIAQGAEATGVGAAPSVYLRDDPICGTQLENQSELRAPSADKAAHYLDAALAARNVADEDEARSSHLLFTLNVYQYRIEKANTKAGLPGVAGGRSRLHLIDLGTASKSKEPNNVSLSLSALGNVIMALLNGQRHVPHRDSKIGQLLRDSLGNLSCRTCMIAHVSSAVPHYNETLQVIQLAARIHRMKRRRIKFSSTSSEDSSTDGEVKFRRPYRGMRMGTLREDILYSSSHSDPDYTSSSEQSCDTVIYIGQNGQSLSDKELTDNEGPPRHVPRTNPRLPRRPSGSRSSGDDSDSGRSVRSIKSVDSRIPLRPLGSQASGQLGSTPPSPKAGLVKMPHRMGIHSKMTQNSEGQWQEKPTKVHVSSSQSKLAKSIHDKQQPLDGEQWIDGPGTAIYPERKASEMWVDGPPVFVVKQNQQPQQTAPSLSSTPSSRGDSTQQHHRSDSFSHHHKTDSLRRAATKKVDAEEQWVDGPKEMILSENASQPLHTCSKSDQASMQGKQSPAIGGVNEKALKQALVKHIVESKDKRDSSASMESNFSIAVEAADSRPQSFMECDEEAGKKNTIDHEAAPSRKPHSSLPPHSSSPSPRQIHKTHKLEANHGPRLEKSHLPGSASPTYRVRQWIKSVSSEQTEENKVCAEAPQCDTMPREQSVQVLEQPLVTEAISVLMADAETNTEHDSDFELLAEENCSRSTDGEDTIEKEKSVSAVNNNMELLNSNVEKCNNTLDISMDSSIDTNGLTRESIYEMEIEENLEMMKAKDGSHLAADVDNDTFSSMSCSTRDPDDRHHPCPESESLLVQHTKALTESRKSDQLARRLAKDGCRKRETSPAYSDYDNDASDSLRPMLCRKPDGASNPNLDQLCYEEELISKRALNCQQPVLESVYALANHSDSVMDFPTNSPKASHVSFSGKDSFCDNYCVQSISEKGNPEFNSPKFQQKNKPPLPTKSSPVMKPSGLPKLCGASSTSSLSHHNYKMSSKENSPDRKSAKNVQDKLSNLPTSNVITRGRLGSKGDKSCASSSGISSATSSPLVSTTSKSPSSVSSSPCLKKSSKSQNGVTSKIPFCSSQTSPLGKESGKLKKKEKETKGSNKTVKIAESVHKAKGNDSDSGNDSGIVAHEKKLMSPYATITKPRTPSHSSSGHGSDNSTVSTEVHPGQFRQLVKVDTIHCGTSSGYESMLRDSEATASSSGHDDSGSENGGHKGGKRKGTRRSKSAPARSTEGSPSLGYHVTGGSMSVGSTHKAWVDTRNLHKVKDEPLELKHYDTDDMERMARRRQEEEMSMLESKQMSGDKKDTDSDSKDHIMIERQGWSFDCNFLMCFSCKSRKRGTDV